MDCSVDNQKYKVSEKFNKLNHLRSLKCFKVLVDDKYLLVLLLKNTSLIYNSYKRRVYGNDYKGVWLAADDIQTIDFAQMYKAGFMAKNFHVVNFENVLDKVPEKAQTELLFNLEMFR